jgi:hypothetical protein
MLPCIRRSWALSSDLSTFESLEAASSPVCYLSCSDARGKTCYLLLLLLLKFM